MSFTYKLTYQIHHFYFKKKINAPRKCNWSYFNKCSHISILSIGLLLIAIRYYTCIVGDMYNGSVRFRPFKYRPLSITSSPSSGTVLSIPISSQVNIVQLNIVHCMYGKLNMIVVLLHFIQ